MKAVTTIFVLILCLQIQGYVIKVPPSTTYTGTVTEEWVHIQKLLLPLFENVCEESTEPIIERLNEEFKLDPTGNDYLKSDVLENFQSLQTTKGLLGKGEIFTEYNPDHLNELKIIFELLYYARDFDTFYKAASWARQNVNCGLYVDAIYLAILNRRDTEKVSVPAPYEILPNYFIRKDFIVQASSLMSNDVILPSDSIRNEGNAYILDVNYTTSFYDNIDDKLTYFHEDIGLNSYYFLTKLNNMAWFSDSERNKYGEYFYHIMKQMMARYNLERNSNGLPELEGIDWDYINESPYDSMLIYSNGNEFSQIKSTSLGDSEILALLKTIESNLLTVVIHMRDGGYNKSEILNHLIETLVTSEKSYMNLGLKFLCDDDKLLLRSPSVLLHYMTSARDPIFWKLNKKIVDLIDNALQVLPSYSRNQLYFPGVEIQNVEVKKMMTTFDNFEFDVTNALKSEGKDSKFKVKISQSRLNHKPFSFKINVLSLVAQKGLVKIYIGPKIMPGELVEKKDLFMLLDCFEVNLKIGNNLLTRSSQEMTNLSEDFLSLEAVRKIVLDAEFGVNALPLKSTLSQIGFPSRLILPKGSSAGLPLHAFVFIAPFVKATVGGSRTNMELNTDAILSPGYPLDLNIEIQQLFNLPNAMAKDITIIHKSESTSYNKPSNSFNTAPFDRVWDTSDLSENNILPSPLYLSARPEFTKKTFDYKSKKNQYGKKTDYGAKRIDIAQNKNTDEKTDTLQNKINNITEPENMEVVNNIYINRDVAFKKIQDINTDKTFLYDKLDKDFDNENFIKSNSKFDENEFEKIVDINKHDKDITTEPEGMDVVNNIYISRDIEHDNVPVIHEDKAVHKEYTLEKDIDNISINSNEDKIKNNGFVTEKKEIEIKKSNVAPHELLTMPRKRFTNTFNIIFNPLKLDSKEKVYE